MPRLAMPYIAGNNAGSVIKLACNIISTHHISAYLATMYNLAARCELFNVTLGCSMEWSSSKLSYNLQTC